MLLQGTKVQIGKRNEYILISYYTDDMIQSEIKFHISSKSLRKFVHVSA